MVTDLKERRAFEMVHGKDHRSLTEQLEAIPGRERVKVVVIDMSSTYKSFVKKFFPNAVMVADKFHVLRLFTPQIMKAGKDIHGHRQELTTRRKLLRSRVKLDYFVRVDIDRYLKNHDKLNELYRWKEKLFEFYRIKALEEHAGRLKNYYLRWKHQLWKRFSDCLELLGGGKMRY